MRKHLLKIIYVLLFSAPVLLFAQNVGIGTLTPTQAKLQIQGVVGGNMLIARSGAASSGITLGNVGSAYPTLGFNAEFSSGYSRMYHGRAGFFQFDALSGDNIYWLSSDSMPDGAGISNYFVPIIFKGSGNVRINNYLGINANGNIDSGRVIIAHNSTIASPTLKLLETTTTDYTRLELSNTASNRFWHIAGFNSTTGANADRLNIYHSTAGDIMSFNGSGQVAIGSPIKFTVDNSYKLSINGKVICTEMKVQLAAAWPDYVFGKKYQLRSLPELETYITENQHLPNIPSASEIKDGGLSIGDMQKRLMEKVEELTLYIIKQDKQIGEQNKRIQLLEKKRN